MPSGCMPTTSPSASLASASRSAGAGSPCTSTGIWRMVRIAQPTTRLSKMSWRATKRTCRRGEGGASATKQKSR